MVHAQERRGGIRGVVEENMTGGGRVAAFVLNVVLIFGSMAMFFFANSAFERGNAVEGVAEVLFGLFSFLWAAK